MEKGIYERMIDPAFQFSLLTIWEGEGSNVQFNGIPTLIFEGFDDQCTLEDFLFSPKDPQETNNCKGAVLTIPSVLHNVKSRRQILASLMSITLQFMV